MELTQLAYFREIAKQNSISKASEILHISQPALSMMLKKLEKECGTPLFSHSSNKLTLNEAGEIMLRHTELILRQRDLMKSELEDYILQQSYIRLGFCDPDPMWYCIPRLPLMNLSLHYDLYTAPVNEASLLLNGKYDILIASEELNCPDIISHPFIKERLYLSVSTSHPLAKETEISIKDPRISSLYLFAVNGTFEKKQAPFWDSMASHLNITWTDDYFVFSQMLLNPTIVTLTTEIVQHYRNDGPGRILIPVTDPELAIDYHIAYQKRKKQKLNHTLTLLRHCAECLQTV